MKYLIAFISAFLCSIGLAISGMTDPKNVIGFLDLFGNFNPQLQLGMVGAITFNGDSYFLIKRKPSPLLTEDFLIPANKKNRFNASFLSNVIWNWLGHWWKLPSTSNCFFNILIRISVYFFNLYGSKYLSIFIGPIY